METSLKLKLIGGSLEKAIEWAKKAFDWAKKFLKIYRRRTISGLAMTLGIAVVGYDRWLLIVYLVERYYLKNPDAVFPSSGSTFLTIVGVVVFLLGLFYSFLDGALLCYGKGYFHDYRLLRKMFKTYPYGSMNTIWNILNHNQVLWNSQLDQLEKLEDVVTADDYNLQDEANNKELKKFGLYLDRYTTFLAYKMFSNQMGGGVLYKMNSQNPNYSQYALRNHRFCLVLSIRYKKLYSLLWKYKLKILSEIFI